MALNILVDLFLIGSSSYVFSRLNIVLKKGQKSTLWSEIPFEFTLKSQFTRIGYYLKNPTEI